MVFKRYGLKGDVAAAVLVAALLLGLYTRQLLDLGGQREAESAAEIAATEQAWPDLALIRDAALFSAPQAGGGEASPSAGVSKLQGIFHNADARGESAALIADENGQGKLYHEGERLSDGSEILEIFPDRVRVSMGGQPHVLWLRKKPTE